VERRFNITLYRKMETCKQHDRVWYHNLLGCKGSCRSVRLKGFIYWRERVLTGRGCPKVGSFCESNRLGRARKEKRGPPVIRRQSSSGRVHVGQVRWGGRGVSLNWA